MINKLDLLIFTDMDGSLLNHDDYTFEAAKPLLKQLKNEEIPVIPNTSKTLAELEKIRQDLDNSDPFIIENGAAVYIPVNYFTNIPDDCIIDGDYWVKSFASERRHWQQLISQLDAKFRPYYQTFSEAKAEGIAALTGLNIEDAKLASQRQFNEPMAWHGPETLKQECIKALSQSGAHILEGGRFLHVSGDCDKAQAMQWLSKQFERNNNTPSKTIAIGDSGNDIAMLEAADFSICVKSPKASYPVLQRKNNIYYTEHIAPTGWTEGLSLAINHLKNA